MKNIVRARILHSTSRVHAVDDINPASPYMYRHIYVSVLYYQNSYSFGT